MALAGSSGAVVTAPGKQIEHLDRGVVAMLNAAGKPFISWSALATDPAGTLFNVYRGASKLNTAPLDLTNRADTGGSATDI